MMTREEHLAWCKARALEYCDMGDASQAWSSFASDMSKNPETANHGALRIGIGLLLLGCSIGEMRKFILGFN